jgi:hypothetical protein
MHGHGIIGAGVGLTLGLCLAAALKLRAAPSALPKHLSEARTAPSSAPATPFPVGFAVGEAFGQAPRPPVVRADMTEGRAPAPGAYSTTAPPPPPWKRPADAAPIGGFVPPPHKPHPVDTNNPPDANRRRLEDEYPIPDLLEIFEP